MTEAAGDYDLCGWRVASALPLPDLSRWQGDARAPDVTIEIGEVPPFESPAATTPMVQIDDARRLRFDVEGVAAYRIEGGSRITVAPAMPLDSPDIRLFLLGSGLGYLCHQRGVVPIHAATVEIDGEAVSFAGASGAGKSTLADAFVRRGYALLSDDVSPVDLAHGTILPSLQRVRLWADAVGNAGFDTAGLERCQTGLEKFSRPLTHLPRATPLPPRALFHLEAHPGERAIFRRLRGRNAAQRLRRQLYRRPSLVALYGEAEAMVRIAAAAAAIPSHFTLERPMAFGALDALVDEIVATVRSVRDTG